MHYTSVYTLGCFNAYSISEPQITRLNLQSGAPSCLLDEDLNYIKHFSVQRSDAEGIFHNGKYAEINYKIE